MKRSKRFVFWIVVVVICFSCVMYFLISNFSYIIFFPAVFERPLFQVAIFGSIVALLIISYRYVVNRSANKTRVRLLYTVIGMLVVFAFAFVEYKQHQEKLIIEEACAQYETACEVPNKRIRVLLLYPWARKASVINTPFGSLNREIFLEKIDGAWYFTGEVRPFLG